MKICLTCSKKRRMYAITVSMAILTVLSTQYTSPSFGVGEEQNNMSSDPVLIINNIKLLLNQSLIAYESQDYQEAERIATVAYLENYENVEEPIAQHDEQLMEETEVLLREDLRQMIRDRVPVSQLQDHVAQINSNLDRAVSLLQGTNP